MRKKSLLLVAVSCSLVLSISGKPNIIEEEETVPVTLQNPGYYTLAYQEEEERTIQITEERMRRVMETVEEEAEATTLEPVIMNVSAYSLNYEDCGKYPDDPYYGITASGERVREWHTIAAAKDIPFGTKIYIPYFKDEPNKGIFVVEDRGGAIKTGKLDVYMIESKDAKEFGRRDLEVYILGKDD